MQSAPFSKKYVFVYSVLTTQGEKTKQRTHSNHTSFQLTKCIQARQKKQITEKTKQIANRSFSLCLLSIYCAHAWSTLKSTATFVYWWTIIVHGLTPSSFSVCCELTSNHWEGNAVYFGTYSKTAREAPNAVAIFLGSHYGCYCVAEWFENAPSPQTGSGNAALASHITTFGESSVWS